MSHKEIRKKFLEFFKKNGHCVAPSSSLVPKDDSSVLLTTAGMQQFKPYYLENESLYGNRVTSIQKCFRTSDIKEVGDERHLTFFEMLGNFSFKYPGGKASYFKKEAVKLAYEFITKEMNLEIDYVSVFGGNDEIPRDDESVEIWEATGIPEEKIKFFGKEDNFWGPTGNEGPCGPTTEIYVNGIEIWNIVFNEYYFDGENFKKLKYQGIDTGMGLERLTMAVQKTPTIFETDLFSLIITRAKSSIQNSKLDEVKIIRIIADHLRGTVFLIADGLLPSNVGAGYILRRILRRAARYAENDDILEIVKVIINEYNESYPELKNNENKIIHEIKKEIEGFKKTLEKGLKEFNYLVLKNNGSVTYDQMDLSGKHAFYLYQTYGFPKEMMQEICKEKNIDFDNEGFETEFKCHQEISRAGVENKFGGHGVQISDIRHQTSENNEKITKLHTATHLLQAALRKILGDEVHQMGSDINEKRLRFDFSFGRKLTNDEISAVQNLVNKKIKEGLDVFMEEMSYNNAIAQGFLAFFKEKYPKTVTVYSVHDFSKEICGGPHAKNTGELGKFKIIKEESSSAGIRRIKAILE